jgi:uncharacterized protein involved in exopolysaccharide biosynthesis
MSKSITFFNNSSKSEASIKRWPIYFTLGVIANAAIWSTALLFLQKQPVYTSTLSATLPSTGSAAKVTLPNIGQASYESSSPYASSTQDPRENYKFLAESDPVLRAAATKLNMSLEEFGRPRIKIVPNTTIMTFEFKGESPEEARDKALTLYNALEVRLNELRSQEVAQRNAGFQAALDSSQEKLEIAQKRLSAYKASSGLSSNEQLKDISFNIEELRKKRAETLAQKQQVSARLAQLSTNLNLSAQKATSAFALQSDQLFQQTLKEYSDASNNIVVLSTKFMPDHPAVISEKAKLDAAQRALLARGETLLGEPVNLTSLQQINLSSTNASSARETLFQEVVGVQADQRGFSSQAQELDKQITQLEARLSMMAQHESVLDALRRDVQIAEAVFSSTLTRLDIDKADTFGSYSLIQMLAEPSLSEAPTAPKKQFVLLGAALGSVFSTNGLALLWLRKRKVEKPQ